VITVEKVPLVDLGFQISEIADEVRSGWDRILEERSFILGQDVEDFEGRFARYLGVDHVVGVGTGTDALELALRGGGIEPGDEVILPANTFIATAEAVLRAGAQVKLVDCDERFLIDPARVADAIEPRTAAIIGVHLYGQAAPMETLRTIAGGDVLLVEDAAQAQGARRNSIRAGALGDVAGTSFYPGKNLGAYGDGGAVITTSHRIAQTVRQLRNHGGLRRYEHHRIGTNSRLDTLQAVVLSAKLARLDDWNEARRRAAAYYDELLADVPGVVLPATAEGNEHVFHLYVIRVPQRDRVCEALGAAGIGCGVHYPAPLHLLPAFSFLDLPAGSFPVAERLSGQILSLPIYPGIRRSQQEYVAETLSRALGVLR
jgi:dTDP-4-amino-4,6-dideoxygalactose transaminase